MSIDSPGEQTPDTELVPVRSILNIGDYVFGKRAMAPPVMDETIANGRRQEVFNNFVVQRSVVYSSCETDVMEADQVKDVLKEAQGSLQLVLSAHATIISEGLGRRIMAANQGVSIIDLAAACRREAAKLPAKQYGHVSKVATFGNKARPFIGFLLDRSLERRLLDDSSKLLNYFGVEAVGIATPHVTMLNAPDGKTGEFWKKRLSEAIHPRADSHESDGARPSPSMTIGLGEPTVLMRLSKRRIA